jgi:hypothetical protein
MLVKQKQDTYATPKRLPTVLFLSIAVTAHHASPTADLPPTLQRNN